MNHSDNQSSRHSAWSPRSWEGLPARYQPEYRDHEAYTGVLEQIASLPPLVFPGEVEMLEREIAEAAAGRRFVLHGGDCVERFIDCTRDAITNRIKILLQMSIVLSHAARRPVLRIGRMAGQYFKPRSSETEAIDGNEVLTYRGDTVNGIGAAEREPDPMRLQTGYYRAAATLNYIRSMISGGFADLHHPYTWNLRQIESSAKWEEYRQIVESVLDAIHFMESFGATNGQELGRVDFFTSHEGLHLDYESALTRKVGEQWYNLGAHFLWIGERTRSLDGAHVEYFRGIANPIGVKVSADADPQEIVQLCRVLNPLNRPGRLTLITRMGANSVAQALPPLIRAVADAGLAVAWSCDPMHGNTHSTVKGIKTRRFDSILDEITGAFAAHRECSSELAGVHFELTGDEVTECIGGAVELSEGDLTTNYVSYCDPRLNNAQSMEMAFLISRLLSSHH